MADGPKQIAILGGGPAALAAAFGLTEQPGWQQHYAITVYQLGWRLGGKCASGRNADVAQRIEEHGLHVWAGFYENAFRVIRACYREMGRSPDAPLATWRDAFKPHNFITVEERVGGGWRHWNVNLPTNPCLPGDGGPIPTPWGYVPQILGWMIETFIKHRHETGHQGLAGAHAHPWLPGWLDGIVRDVEAVGEAVGAGVSSLPFLQSAWKLASTLPPNPTLHAPDHHRGVLWLLNRFMRRLTHCLGPDLLVNDTLRRLWIIMDFAAAHVRGLLADGVIFRGFDAIDAWEWSDWLRKHGAAELTLQSPLVRGTYDYIFGFRGGDTSKPAVAAGTCVRGLLRLAFTAKGAVFWEMQAGMGDTVLTPLYLVLRKRGVRFEFFQRVRKLGLSDDKKAVGTIVLGRQVTLKDPAAGYGPLVNVKGLECWPSAPLYEQIVEGPELQAKGVDLESAWTPWPDREERTLRLGKDFDLVVLGISLGALKDICADLVAASDAWKNLVEKVQTVQTQALQLWLRRDALGLGWDCLPTILTAYAEPLDTWGDLSHLVRREDWPAGQVPASIAYFCGPLADADPAPAPPDPDFPAKQKARVKATAFDWLTKNTGHIWPRAVSPPGSEALDWELLTDLHNRAGPARLDAQYWRANVNPSDRYVLSLPGSTAYRLRAGESGFANLFLAGDWVRTGINAGCVEAAVMAGLQASRAICGHPQVIPGESDGDLRPLPPAPAVPGWARRAARLVRVLLRRIGQALGGIWPAARQPGPAKPAYVEVGGEQVFCQPLTLTGVRFFSFLLRADYGALRALCDKHLNRLARTGVEYHPLLPRVMLGFADIGRAGCANPPDSNKGWMPEVDVAFWVPVVAVRRGMPFSFAERIAWFLPYVFVNNAWASASGREIYGFPKEIGDFQIPASPDRPALFSADTLVLDPYRPETEARVRRVVEVRRKDGGTVGAPGRTWTDPKEALEDFLRALVGGDGKIVLPGLGIAVEVFKLLTHHEVPFVFLKQFRDAADGRQACYQAVVEAPARLLRLRGGGPLTGEYQVTVQPLASHPILQELGLPAGAQSAVGAWHTEFDFVMEGGHEVWKA
jgi:uncharacterized protein with NAD-binding domain and iron-sulfur cluster